ncbi:MAG: amino acid--tRNA ligase-related protein [Spirochaetia bacterium]
MDFSGIKARSSVQKQIRSFFSSRGYLEVETPILSPGVIPEAPIELFETGYIDGEGGERPLYMLPSPELYMKKLLAEGSGDIFQLIRSFRNGEESGPMHNPEFTMLEWYTTKADYHDSIRTAEELFLSLVELAEAESFKVRSGGRPPTARSSSATAAAERLRPPFRTMSVNDAFIRYAGVDLLENQNRKSLLKTVEGRGLSRPSPEESWEQLFNRLLLGYVEPSLPKDSPTVLYDYPAQIPAIAKRCRKGPWIERWELYLGEVEIANCYSEETDPERVRSFCEREYAAKAADARVVPDMDEEFLSLFDANRNDLPSFPDCSGTALGVDRLVMLLTGQASLEGVILFPFSDILR